MSEQQYNQADREVIAMVSNRRNRSGSLPGKQIHYIPQERADVVLDLDRRIEKLRNALPTIALVTLAFALLLTGMNL